MLQLVSIIILNMVPPAGQRRGKMSRIQHRLSEGQAGRQQGRRRERLAARQEGDRSSR
jgi:hypothetical protein